MTLRLAVAAVVLAVLSASVASGQSTTSNQTVTFDQAYKPGGGVTYPTLLKHVQPSFTDAARLAGIQGLVELEIIVLDDGTVGDVRVTKSLDKVHGLDDEAIKAAKQWTFKPAVDRNGMQVPVIVTLILEFRLGVPSQLPGQGTAPQPPPPAASTPTPDEKLFAPDALKPGAAGLVAPKVYRSVQPRYTADAMRAKIAGMVEVQAVVEIDGRIDRVRVTQSLDGLYGLDNEALSAVRQWLFEPGMLNGKPVPVLVTLTLEFRLR